MLGKLLLPRGGMRRESSMARCAAVLCAAAMTSGCTVITNFDDIPADAAPPPDGMAPPDAFAIPAASCNSFESNNTVSSAAAITPGMPLDSAICSGDRDYYSFPAELSQQIRVTLTFQHNGGAGDLNLALFYLSYPDTGQLDAGPDAPDAGPPPDAAIPVQQQVANSNGVGDTEDLMITASMAGTYVIEVLPFGTAQSEYQLDLTVQ